MRQVAARFSGGPWNAETRNVIPTTTIRAEVYASDDEDDDTPPRIGNYRQGDRQFGVVRYQWEGWK